LERDESFNRESAAAAIEIAINIVAAGSELNDADIVT